MPGKITTMIDPGNEQLHYLLMALLMAGTITDPHLSVVLNALPQEPQDFVVVSQPVGRLDRCGPQSAEKAPKQVASYAQLSGKAHHAPSVRHKQLLANILLHDDLPVWLGT